MSITFDGPNKLFILNSGTTELDVKDFWSRWYDWFVTSDNAKYGIALGQIGGQQISATANSYIPVYISLLNGWKIRPQEATHTLTVTQGVILTPDSSDPFVPTIGAYNVMINYQQPVSSISVASAVTGADLNDINTALLALSTQLTALKTDALTKNQYLALS